MTKKPKLTVKEAKVVKAKIAATIANKPQNEAAMQVFPNQTPEAAAVSMTRTLKKANVQEALQIALEKHGLTPDSIVTVVAEGMKAEKVITSPTEPDYNVPDHSIRLKAAGMASGFMGINKPQEGGPSIHFHQHVEDQRKKYDI